MKDSNGRKILKVDIATCPRCLAVVHPAYMLLFEAGRIDGEILRCPRCFHFGFNVTMESAVTITLATGLEPAAWNVDNGMNRGWI